MPTVEQYLNSPKDIKINEELRVQVESLAPAWVTLVLKRLAEYKQKQDAPFLASLVEKIQNAIGNGDTQIDFGELVTEIYQRSVESDLALGESDFGDEELEIIRLMTIPNHLWKRYKGSFADYEFPYTIEYMKECFTESHLMAIWNEWWARNPMFERKKKMMNPGMTQ